MASFKSLNSWLEDLKKYGEEDIVVLVVGNKSDGIREVEESVARRWAEVEGLEYVETSALNGQGVDEVRSKWSTSSRSSLCQRLLTFWPLTLHFLLSSELSGF